MSNRISWIEVKGSRILYEDYSNLQGDDLLDVLYEAEEVFRSLEGEALVLVNFEKTTANREFIDEMGRLALKYIDKHKKIANIGVSSIQQVLAEVVNDAAGLHSKVAYFNNSEEAVNYLLE